MIQDICKLLDSNSDSTRDISFLALKELTCGAPAAVVLSPSLFATIKDVLLKLSAHEKSASDALEILALLFGRLKGQVPTAERSKTVLSNVSQIYPNLLHSRQNIRKKAIAAIGAAVHALQDADFQALVLNICDSLTQHQKKTDSLVTFLELVMHIWFALSSAAIHLTLFSSLHARKCKNNASSFLPVFLSSEDQENVELIDIRLRVCSNSF